MTAVVVLMVLGLFDLFFSLFDLCSAAARSCSAFATSALASVRSASARFRSGSSQCPSLGSSFVMVLVLLCNAARSAADMINDSDSPKMSILCTLYLRVLHTLCFTLTIAVYRIGTDRDSRSYLQRNWRAHPRQAKNAGSAKKNSRPSFGFRGLTRQHRNRPPEHPRASTL